MVLDYIIVGVVVAGAVAYLAWTFRPRRAKPARYRPVPHAGSSAVFPPGPSSRAILSRSQTSSPVPSAWIRS